MTRRDDTLAISRHGPIPLPLLPPDTDVVLDLPAALTAIYEEAAYDLSIDYSQSPPPPEFSAADQQKHSASWRSSR
jgi:hypothetical protein